MAISQSEFNKIDVFYSEDAINEAWYLAQSSDDAYKNYEHFKQLALTEKDQPTSEAYLRTSEEQRLYFELISSMAALAMNHPDCPFNSKGSEAYKKSEHPNIPTNEIKNWSNSIFSAQPELGELHKALKYGYIEPEEVQVAVKNLRSFIDDLASGPTAEEGIREFTREEFFEISDVSYTLGVVSAALNLNTH